MTESWEAFEQLFRNLGILLLALIQFVLNWWLVIAWLAVSLWAINWRKLWPVLGRGAWVPLVLGMVLVALAWSQMAPSDEANFWSQLGVVTVVVVLTFLCGWLQEALGWTPAEIDLEPPLPVGSQTQAHH